MEKGGSGHLVDIRGDRGKRHSDLGNRRIENSPNI